MRIKVIMNPYSDQGRAAHYQDRILALGASFGGLDVVLTERPGHGRELARSAADDGYDLVVAAGGDGTVHEVVNGLVQGDKADVRLGVIPIGSGNDFAYGLGIPLDLEAAVARLFQGQPRRVDLARVEDDRGRYAFFDNNLGIGFDAIVVIKTESITRVHGFLMYFLSVLQTIAFYYQTPRLEVRFDDEAVAQEVLFLSMGIGPRGGGGFFLTPDAVQDDDLIDSCTVNPIGRLTMLSMLSQAIKGTHVNSRHVTMRRNRRIIIRASTPMPIHLDGEVFAYPQDNVRRLTVTSVPAAIEVMG
ncbi:MAG: diacylglycerol/lipid kinase family protein [Anaerolineae bacterium]